MDLPKLDQFCGSFGTNFWDTSMLFVSRKHNPQRLHSTKENPIFRTFPNGYHCVYSWESTPTFPNANPGRNKQLFRYYLTHHSYYPLSYKVTIIATTPRNHLRLQQYCNGIVTIFTTIFFTKHCCFFWDPCNDFYTKESAFWKSRQAMTTWNARDSHWVAPPFPSSAIWRFIW